MDAITLLLLVGAILALIAAIFGDLRRVNIVGGMTVAALVGLMAFGPSEPHPFLDGLAFMALPSAIVGWLVGAALVFWRNTKQEINP